MISQQSKIQIVMHPPMPATCCVCNKSADGVIRFLDFQLSLDYYGAVVICEDCAKEMLSVISFVPVAWLEETEGKLQVTKALLSTSVESESELRNALNSVLRVRPDLSSDVVIDDETNKQDFSDHEEHVRFHIENFGTPERESDETESRLDESDAERGPENLFESTDPNFDESSRD